MVDVDGRAAERPAPLRSSTMASIWAASQFAWQVAACTLIGLAIDRWLGTLPWGTLICSLFGMVTAVYLLIRASQRLLADTTPPKRFSS